MIYFPYNRQNGTRSSKCNGKDNKLKNKYITFS